MGGIGDDLGGGGMVYWLANLGGGGGYTARLVARGPLVAFYVCGWFGGLELDLE